MSNTALILLLLLLPLFGAAGVVVARRNPNVREGVTLLTGGAVVVLVVYDCA